MNLVLSEYVVFELGHFYTQSLIKGMVIHSKDKYSLAQTGYKRQNILEVVTLSAFFLVIFDSIYSSHSTAEWF